MGHDIGHAPFGHEGENALRRILSIELGKTFWHEGNSLWFADSIETLKDNRGLEQNLNLTYAVRDGIVCHCGEVDDGHLVPRIDAMDLTQITEGAAVSPFTWEGCVVKIADKISYLGRDIEDALTLRLLSRPQQRELTKLVEGIPGYNLKLKDVTNTFLIHEFIVDLCNNSTPEEGLRLSENLARFMANIKKWNYDNIYAHERLAHFRAYARLIIDTLFGELSSGASDPVAYLDERRRNYPELIMDFEDWLIKYTNFNEGQRLQKRYHNKIVYDINEAKEYKKCVIDYISGMTDTFALRLFRELTAFR